MRVLVYYLYTPANRNDALILVRIYPLYLASIDSLHQSSINYTDAYILLEAMHITKILYSGLKFAAVNFFFSTSLTRFIV